jgi:hypothetical protein
MKPFALFLGVFLSVSATAQPAGWPIGVKVKSPLADGSLVALVGTEEVPERDLLNNLTALATVRGPQTPVKIFVHESLPLARILGLRDVAKKAGFASVRLFYFADERGDLVELCFGKPFPAVGGTIKAAPAN